MNVAGRGGTLPGSNMARMRFMGVSDVASLIINKVFGTGIFSNPVGIMLATQAKWQALLLWFLGLVFTWGRYGSYSNQHWES